jgi:hypothetical protein
MTVQRSQAHRSARPRLARTARELGMASDAALDAALISGSDTRLAIDAASRMNAYGSRPSPRPEEISLSSSTASTISAPGYAAARAAFSRLDDARAQGRFAAAFAQLVDEVRGAIRTQFDLADAEVVLSPSGTDGALQASFLARGLLGRPITSIVVAADETGNGVPAAAAGRHFADVTSAGRAVRKGEPIAGLACAAVTILGRDRTGRARPAAQIDAEVASAAASAFAAGNGVALHVMDHSKLGSRVPSIGCVREICALAPGAVQVVVDACQGRLGRTEMRRYLDQGFLVLLTGSKFFAGPPLSGALLVPDAMIAGVERIADVPEGLADYTARDDWPACFGLIRDRLPARQNVGQALRWIAAIEEMRAYFAVPELFRRFALVEFAAAAARQISRRPELALLAELHASRGEGDAVGDEFAARTILPFTVNRAGRLLDLAQARALHQALNRDGAALGFSDPLALTPCHIGQPVALGDGAGRSIGVLRISADARMISESWAGTGDLVSTGRLTARLDQIGTVLDKLVFLLPHLDRLDGVSVS